MECLTVQKIILLPRDHVPSKTELTKTTFNLSQSALRPASSLQRVRSTDSLSVNGSVEELEQEHSPDEEDAMSEDSNTATRNYILAIGLGMQDNARVFRKRSPSVIVTERTFSEDLEYNTKLKPLMEESKKFSLDVERWLSLSEHAWKSRRNPINPDIGYHNRSSLINEDPTRICWIYYHNHPKRQLASLHIDQLRLEELYLLKQFNREALEYFRAPLEHWYELKGPQFHYEHHKNMIYLDDDLGKVCRKQAMKRRKEVRRIDKIATELEVLRKY